MQLNINCFLCSSLQSDLRFVIYINAPLIHFVTCQYVVLDLVNWDYPGWLRGRNGILTFDSFCNMLVSCFRSSQLGLSWVVGREDWNPAHPSSIPASDMTDVGSIDSIHIFFIPHMEYTVLHL